MCSVGLSLYRIGKALYDYFITKVLMDNNHVK